MMPQSDERPHFFSEAECHDIADRLFRMTQGKGYTAVGIRSSWTGNVRWARNEITTSGEVLNHIIAVGRSLNGAGNRMVWVNDVDDVTLTAAVRRAERLASMATETPQSDLITERPLEAHVTPSLFSDATYNVDAAYRSHAARDLAKSAVDAGMLSAGYVEVSARSQALIDSLGRARYFQYTQAQYTVTVRDPKGSGSGWAGVDWHDWAKIDGPALSNTALQKCLTSRDPVRMEPGRYTAILEPQAVGDFVGRLVYDMDRQSNESTDFGPFTKGVDPKTGAAISHLGDKVVDERITITSDPMDPQAGFPPFDIGYGTDGVGDPFEHPVFHRAAWIEHGVLRNLSYQRDYGIHELGLDTGLPMPGGFRMSGGPTSIDEMITTTQRGVLVTRFDRIMQLDRRSQLYTGYTRDGLWLVENGKITKAIKNFAFTESILFALNKVQQLGPPQRVFHPGIYMAAPPSPVVVPPLKIDDFSFTALTDAV